jgi:regulatory protein
MSSEEFKKALARAFKLLSLRDHSRRELSDKLLRKGFSISVAENVIRDLEDRGFLNDMDFGKDFVRHCQVVRNLGPRAIRAELYKRGITGESVDEVLDEYSGEIEKEKLLAIVRRKFENGYTREKVYNYLRRKGYFSDIIFSAIKEVYPEEGE